MGKLIEFRERPRPSRPMPAEPAVVIILPIIRIESYDRTLDPEQRKVEKKIMRRYRAAKRRAARCPDCLGTGRGSCTDPEAKCESCGGTGKTRRKA